jgi:signal transduction histidine kinase/ActR/RegA family two-component response regulator
VHLECPKTADDFTTIMLRSPFQPASARGHELKRSRERNAESVHGTILELDFLPPPHSSLGADSCRRFLPIYVKQAVHMGYESKIIDPEVQAKVFHIQKMDAIGQLAAGIAHDFNNLLLVISSYAELGMEGLPPRHPVHQRLQEILNASRRAAILTKQLLTFGREQERSPQELDMNAFLGNLSKLLARLLGENIEFRLFPGKHLARTKADPVQLEQILLNLANNARDAMPKGGRFTLETSNVRLDDYYLEQHPAVLPGDYVLLTVSDTGHGIPPEHLAHVFEPFFTTKEPGRGTGLGLATVYGIVKQSGGHIWVYSERDLGTTFKIYLPAVLVATDPVPLTPVVQPGALRGSETILVVEDEECVRLPACEYLSRCGYHVLQACDGQDAVTVASAYDGAIHLLVTDVVMPRMSGNELAAYFWKQRPETRVLYLSGYSTPTLLQHGIGGHDTLFLEKPFTLKELSAKIRQALSVPSHAPAESACTPTRIQA